MNLLPYLRISGLIVLPTFALLPWFLFLLPKARVWGLTTNVDIQAVADITADLRVSEFANRLIAISATSLLVLIALFAGWLAVASVWKSPAKPVWKLGLLGTRPYALVFWAVWFLIMALGLGDAAPQVVKLFGDNFNANTVGKDHPELLALLKCNFVISAAAAAFAGSALAAAATCIVLEAEADTPAPNLAELESRANYVLYGTAALLVAGVLAAEAWASWPNPLVRGNDRAAIERIAMAEAKLEPMKTGETAADYTVRVTALKEKKAAEMKANADAFDKLKTGFLAVQSVCYVMGLAFTYLPAALAIAAARNRPGVRATAPPTPYERLGKLIVLLSPLLAGPITRLIEYLTKFGG